MASIISGVFFPAVCATAGFARPADLDILIHQLLAATGNGMRVQAEKLGQDRIASVTKLQRFQTGVQAALLFIQHTLEQDDGCFHFVGRDFQTRSVNHSGNGLAAVPREALPSARCRVDGHVEEQAGDEFTRDSLLLDQLLQSVLHCDVQCVSEFPSWTSRVRSPSPAPCFQ